MTKGNCLYKKMSAVGKVLSEDPETKDRYANATDGGRDWFCYSAWLVENRSRWHDGETARCRDSIASRLTSTDIAYVLQYETDADVVAYLKARLIDAVNKETTPIRLAGRGDWLANTRGRWQDFVAKVPTEAEGWSSRKIDISDFFYSRMMPFQEALSNDPDTKRQYELARHGGKEWFCFSWWIAEDRTRWNDQETIEYRESLVSWLGSVDIAHVLQFETDAKVVEYLKERLALAIERETTPKRLEGRSRILSNGLYKKYAYGKETTGQLAAKYGGGAGMICRIYSAMKGYADYLKGKAPGAGYWTHPDCHLYLAWYNKYVAPTNGLCRVQ